ncbi:MAG: hypothetical protein LUO89_09290 [Methanothrix sp.]|nr:hypothetical protein [Methanothrix sp.]
MKAPAVATGITIETTGSSSAIHTAAVYQARAPSYPTLPQNIPVRPRLVNLWPPPLAAFHGFLANWPKSAPGLAVPNDSS